MLKFVVYFVIAAVVVIAAASVWHLMRVAAGNKEEMASMPSGASLSSAAKTVAALSRRPMR